MTGERAWLHVAFEALTHAKLEAGQDVKVDDRLLTYHACETQLLALLTGTPAPPEAPAPAAVEEDDDDRMTVDDAVGELEAMDLDALAADLAVRGPAAVLETLRAQGVTSGPAVAVLMHTRPGVASVAPAARECATPEPAPQDPARPMCVGCPEDVLRIMGGRRALVLGEDEDEAGRVWEHADTGAYWCRDDLDREVALGGMCEVTFAADPRDGQTAAVIEHCDEDGAVLSEEPRTFASLGEARRWAHDLTRCGGHEPDADEQL